MGPAAGAGEAEGLAAAGLLPQCLLAITDTGQTSAQVGAPGQLGVGGGNRPLANWP